jgi:hypothetical protein
MRAISFRTFLVLLLVAGIGSTGWAKKKQHHGAAPAGEVPILEVNAVSITVDTGGGQQETYNITDATKVTLDGADSSADNLLAGMMAKITLASDGDTATEIAATNPPRGKKK